MLPSLIAFPKRSVSALTKAVKSAGDLLVTIVIPAEPEHALEAFQHPFAYAAAHGVRPRAEPLAA